ncbi:CotH kinase family protein [Desulforamulus ruminis]|uniref:CotH kinase family protein n=1 Tax=Desulforamulus ruminis TaxID=1564 RepID=UPI0023520213|nr:CotH kinase family protein [Desulforamulus ruminis]
MKKIILFAFVPLLLCLCSITALGFPWQTPKWAEAASSEAVGAAAALSYADEIDQTKIMTIEISVNDSDWQYLLDNATDKEYIQADVTINGTLIKNAGIRAKGNSSLSSIARDETTDRYSFKIKFDEYVDGQTWMGLDKLVLNGNYADATSMKEYLSYDIMRYIGVDAPLFAYADIRVNGKNWGFYLAIEDLDGSYKERAKNDDGELYKPDNDMGGGQPDNYGGQKEGESRRFAPVASDGTEKLPQAGAGNADKMPPTPPSGPVGEESETGRRNDGPGAGRGGMPNMAGNGVSLVYTDDNESSYSAIFDNAKTKTDTKDHQRVIAALKGLNEGKDLEKYVDVDATLRYFAAHTVVVNLDSYISNMGHNYLLYENDGRISMLPWDYNLAFGAFQSRNARDVVNFPIDTPVSGVSMDERPLLGKLLEVPEYLEKYHEYLQEIIEGYFANDKFEQKVDEVNTLISEHIKNDPSASYSYEEYQKAMVELKKFGTLRSQSIQGQLGGTIPSTTEGQKADPGKLVDASTVNLSAMGTQGGGAPNGQPTGGGIMPEGINQEALRSAMEIIQSAENGQLTEDQRTKLLDLGISDEQITQMLKMSQGSRATH